MTSPAPPPLIPIDEVYAELRRVAQGYLRRERARSLQATELVHDAYVRLQADQHPRWQNRAHFLAIAAIAMRRLLVERARARHALKRGGPGQIQVTLTDHIAAAEDTSGLDMRALDEALATLGRLDPQQARIVEMRYFAGMTIEEVADALGISPATVKRDWTLARAWLLRALSGGEATS